MLALDCILNFRKVLVCVLRHMQRYFSHVCESFQNFWINILLSTLVQLLHYILKCNYFGMTTVSFFVKFISIPDEELFSEMYVQCTASYFV